MYARLHIWKQIEVFSFHWYYKTYKLENEFASVYPLMLFAEFDANKTCRAGVGWEWESKHWLNNIDTALKHLLQPFFQFNTKYICHGKWFTYFQVKEKIAFRNGTLSTHIFHCSVLLVVEEPGDRGPGVAARHHALECPAPGLDHVRGRGGAWDGHHRGEHWSQINTWILRPDVIPIQMAMNGALFIFRAM